MDVINERRKLREQNRPPPVLKEITEEKKAEAAQNRESTSRRSVFNSSLSSIKCDQKERTQQLAHNIVQQSEAEFGSGSIAHSHI